MAIEAPFESKEPPENGESSLELFKQLEEAQNLPSRRGRVRKSQFPIWGSKTGQEITGWKFNEFDYGSSKIQLPINARGLFSIVDAETGKQSIIVRGYDKFFNIDEVPTTRWSWIEANTIGPYEVTSKENGCIIFISGLPDGTLIVTSKNSTGPRDAASATEKNHSKEGLKWVQKHLQSKNIDEKDFARLLSSLNITAVGELCDDSFEEHVLAYEENQAGIYLHGLNVNCPNFTTYSCQQVENFANQFGFIPTKYTIYNDLSSLRKFLESCAETGSWNGVEIEGFVIRCKAKLDAGKQDLRDFFFKYKFEEPYLMYRQWREITKAYLNGKPRADLRIAKNMAITNQYLDFIIPLFEKDPHRGDLYLQGHGIIELRKLFLQSSGKTGMQIVLDELASEDQMTANHNSLDRQFSSLSITDAKFLFIPVATVGCGKTTVFLALKYLYPSWGHVQNDEIEKSRGGQEFVKRSLDCLTVPNCPAVLMDRNNHQYRERAQIFTDVQALTRRPIKYFYICLNFLPQDAVSSNDTWSITTQRVMNRKDNHQSIKLSNEGEAKVRGIMKGFISRFQPVNSSKPPDDKFDLIIDLKVSKEMGSRQNLEIILSSLSSKYPTLCPEIPSAVELDKAIAYAIEYKPSFVKKMSGKPKDNQPKRQKAVYFALSIRLPGDLSMVELIDSFFEQNPQADASTWQRLKSTDRVQRSFHVTLTHVTQCRAASHDAKAKEIYNSYQKIIKAPSEPQEGLSIDERFFANVEIKSICWSNDIVALKVEINGGDGHIKIESSNKIPHVTVGTRDSSIPPRLAQAMITDKSSTTLEWNIEPRVLINQPLAAFY